MTNTTGSKTTLQFIPDWAEFGEASLDDLAKDAPFIESFASEELTFPDARFLQVIYEMDMFTAQNYLPSSLAPLRGPSFVMVRAYHFPETPWGETSIAQVGVLCRFGYRPRIFQLAALTDNPDAVEPLRSGWGIPLRTADSVKLKRYHDGSHLSVEDGGRELIQIVTTKPILTAGSSMGINSSVDLVDTPKGLRIVQVAENFTFKVAEVSTPEIRQFDADGWGLPGMRMRYPVSAISTIADITLRPIQFLADAEGPSLLSIRSVEES
ncbi:acetoacetate decarboxylase family protein [Microbacterium sp. zg.Y909]|uniref:acetoacetate decarboxylase family protein n=1 Tax=Microbacterium sp. zg.Y909 TaxID=2969413 RepID=UPI00214B2FCA|nr:acetoacetate decarboxylase family protein [Microbacterium sp. zg.Y909]MCR2824090.1 acetoacetate decarboxylase family protein [Microbacterium sp. zg.Y909]